MLVMPHVSVRLADGSMLAKRLQHIHKTLAAVRRTGLPVLDPKSFVERDGQYPRPRQCRHRFSPLRARLYGRPGHEIVRGLRSL